MPSAEQLDRELVRGYCSRCGFPFLDQARQGVCHVPPACERRLQDPTYKVPSDRLAAIELRVRQHLIQRVKDAGVDHLLQATITYKDLCNAIDPERRYWSPPRFQGVGKVLDRISTYEYQDGRPLLSAVVIQAGAHHAGDGFIRLSRRLGHEIQSGQELAFWRAQVREVAQYWAASGQSGSASSDVYQAKASLGATSPVQQAEEAVTIAAGKAAGPRGQGFQLDQEVKAAVEAHAMNMATEFYAVAWEVEDVHGTESYDLVSCERGSFTGAAVREYLVG